MFFVNTDVDTWLPCGPKQRGAIQVTMQELAEKGLAAKVCIVGLLRNPNLFLWTDSFD